MSVPESFWDHLLNLVWVPFLTIVGWAFHLDRRVSRLETQREAMVEKIDGIESKVNASNEKLDRLIDRLL